ncbi:GtrA family protein [Desemzia incerta]|uniref:GtrA family protein n=1 Tax=Desemzia incerta TaxID=82801 RepID=UPI003CFFFE50
MRRVIDQVFKFGIVGVIAAAIDFGILFILTSFFDVFYLLSAAIAYIVSTAFNYIASMRYVFVSKYDKTEKNKELLIFLVLSLIGLGINEFFMWFFVEKYNIYYILAKVIATVIVMAWNFITRKFFLEGNS